MIRARALLLADGLSDEPLGAHVAALARGHDVVLDIRAPELERLRKPPGRTVRKRLESAMEIDPHYDVLLVHRDCERQTMVDREREIRSGMTKCAVDWPVVPIVPIRMTEAWLLLDETAIRVVAGRPSGVDSLDLPHPSKVESVPNPKARLQTALEAACGLSGRRLRRFKRDFPVHRRELLTRLDRAGPVLDLAAWKALEAAVSDAMTQLKQQL